MRNNVQLIGEIATNSAFRDRVFIEFAGVCVDSNSDYYELLYYRQREWRSSVDHQIHRHCPLYPTIYLVTLTQRRTLRGVAYDKVLTQPYRVPDQGRRRGLKGGTVN